MCSKLLVKFLVVAFLFNVIVVPVVRGETAFPKNEAKPVEKTAGTESSIPTDLIALFGLGVTAWVAIMLFPELSVGILIIAGAFGLFPAIDLVVRTVSALFDGAKKEQKNSPASATTVIKDPASDY